MEDMARLAVLEGNVKDNKLFASILYQLIHSIGDLVAPPYTDRCKLILSESLTQALRVEGYVEYLKYLGFIVEQNKIMFPEDVAVVEKLKTSAKAIKQKLLYSCGIKMMTTRTMPELNDNTKLLAVKVLTTKNSFLLDLEFYFNRMLMYEEKEMLRYARSLIPDLKISNKALDRMQAHQENIKNGTVNDKEMSFELAQLMEVIAWFKHEFFSWVDKPNCQRCGGPTEACGTELEHYYEETCRVEIYKCRSCNMETPFPRYNHPKRLLLSRRGRCGEWANSFAMICRALDYDVRFVCDNADHVWCEIFDFHNKRWLHVDPCEAALDTPLIYEHGWKKNITYVFAFSRDDLQDVTWRYSSKHQEVRSRRDKCSESELLHTILELRAARQLHMTDARKQYLAERCVMELTEFMTERQPNSYESLGRISGAESWRRERGEIGNSHSFKLNKAGLYTINYYPVQDAYIVLRDGKETNIVTGWSNGTFGANNVFRKEETDWKMVYLARTEDANEGFILWKMTTDPKCTMSCLSLKATTKLYESGQTEWSLTFDDNAPTIVKLEDSMTSFPNTFKTLVIGVKLSGGNGDVAWQHAQLFRQSLKYDTSAFEIKIKVA